MPEVTAHPQGTPSWAELSTSDENGALAFYSALLGWSDDPQEMGPDMFYHLQKLNGLEAAAIYQQGEEEKGQGVPPHWNTYFTVDDVDQITAKAGQTGGTVVFGPMDVFDAGRMSFIQDPQGAFFAVWQPKQHIGCRVKNETGAMIWNELMTTDSQAALQFYSGLLGQGTGSMPGPMQYDFLKVGDAAVAGVLQITEEMGPIPPNWSVYFGVDDVDASVAKAQSLGGKVAVPAMDIPEVGRFAGLQDPQGANFNIFKPAAS